MDSVLSALPFPRGARYREHAREFYILYRHKKSTLGGALVELAVGGDERWCSCEALSRLRSDSWSTCHTDRNEVVCTAMVPFSRGALILAPMVGITNRAFRMLIHELGAPDWYMTEMASAEALLSGGRNEAIYLDPSPCPARTSVQFTAKNPDALAAACRALSALPEERRPFGIDINMGCAAPHIKGSGRGAALLDNPDLARAMVEAARANWSGPLSAKIRVNALGGEEGTLRFAKEIAAGGLDFIAVHSRLDTQKFRRRADHSFTARLAAELDIPVVANGDISSASDYRAVLSSGPIYAVMIGRAAVRQPWIFEALHEKPCNTLTARRTSEPKSGHDLLAIGTHFIDLVEALLPPEWQRETCRRVFSYFAENASFAHHLKFSLINSPSLEEMRRTLIQYFDEVPTDRII